MGSTFWVELYFRSLNPNNVLNHLTKYLLQYRRVSIPSVGTIQLLHQPAQLNVAEKILLPPSYATQITSDETVPDHQLAFLAACVAKEKAEVLDLLQLFGAQLKTSIKGAGFNWTGIGLIRYTNEPLPVSMPAPEPVTATRVIRQDAPHNVLVGDQQMTSTQITEQRADDLTVVKARPSLVIIIGWIVLVLSILFIVFILYRGKFRVGATGSKQTVTSHQIYQLSEDEEQWSGKYFC
jgi:hypothetical protein